MSILIKGAKPPSGCRWCYFNEDCKCALIVGCDFDDTNGTQRRKDCPLIELPDHGDLIDRDALFDDNSWDWFNEWGSTVNKQAQLVANAPVVIPAERSEASLCDNCDWKNEKGCSWCKRMESSEEECEDEDWHTELDDPKFAERSEE